jgi:hypothetical protein
MPGEILINGAIDLAHPAGAELSQDFITAGINSSLGDKADR